MSPIYYSKPSPRTTPVSSVNRADLVQDDAQVYNLDLLKDFRVANGAALPAAPDSTTLGISAGAFGTDSPLLESSDTNNGADSEFARVSVVMPIEYRAGETTTVRVHARVDVVRQVGATVDVLAYESDKEAGISADLCTTGAQDANSASWADFDFTITPTTLSPGDTLDIEIVAATDDTGAGAPSNGHIQIGAVQILLDVKG